MKKVIYIVLLCILSVTILGCDSKSDFEKNEITEAHYNSTLDLIDKYRADDFQEKITQIYKSYGTEYFNNDRVTEYIDGVKKEIKNNYYDIYSMCMLENDKQMVLFGYNFSLLCLMEYRREAMDIDSLNYEKEVTEYYEKFCESPCPDTFDDFCLYITKNNIFDYATDIKKVSIEDVSTLIKVNCISAKLYFATVANYIEKGDSAEMYNTYCDAMDALSSITELLKEYPEYKEKFTSQSVTKVDDTIQYSISICEELSKTLESDPYSSDIGIFAYILSNSIEELGDFLDEVSSNALKIGEE